MSRYHRQILLPQIGPAGQQRLAASRVLLVGCGALGTVIAEQLVRAGVGFLRIVDRDVVETTNLQRQVLFDESDAAAELPKAVAAAARLAQVNSEITIEPRVLDAHAGNIEELAGAERGSRPVDLILDGTDNAETRYLLNDVSIKHEIPWIYGACVGTEGRMMAVRPSVTPCLRCIFPTPPVVGELPTCDTAGVFAPTAAVVASLQAAAAIQLLVGAGVGESLVSFDLWNGRFRSTSTADARRTDCIACGQHRYEFLDCVVGATSSCLCGRNAVQVRPAGQPKVDLEQVAIKLAHSGQIERTPHLVRCVMPPPNAFRLTVFPDGRLIVHGTSDLDRARSLYARFLGM
jgi:adenylyltransferase/sulfurtransferase